MEELTKQPLTEEQAKAIAEVARAKAEMIRRAYQSHTRWLFGIWFLLVVVISWLGFGVLSEKMESGYSLVAFVLSFWLVLFTGAYVFQEVRTLHRRIDGILNLIDKK